MRKLSVTDIEKSELIETIFFSKACKDNFTADKKQEYVDLFLSVLAHNNVQFNTEKYGEFSYENRIPYTVNNKEKCIEIDPKFVIDR
ncbi:hypothetical protein [Acinetobacter sp. G18]|uniref:hypothetical protein n=1 Tax=Acinetobacter sp. G18 TaxID=2952152 RepID=UPI0040445F48